MEEHLLKGLVCLVFLGELMGSPYRPHEAVRNKEDG